MQKGDYPLDTYSILEISDKYELIISAAGTVGFEPTLSNHKEQVVTDVSAKSAEKLIQGHGFLFLKDGSVSGISASLLNEGASREWMK